MLCVLCPVSLRASAAANSPHANIAEIAPLEGTLDIKPLSSSIRDFDPSSVTGGMLASTDNAAPLPGERETISILSRGLEPAKFLEQESGARRPGGLALSFTPSSGPAEKALAPIMEFLSALPPDRIASMAPDDQRRAGEELADRVQQDFSAEAAREGTPSPQRRLAIDAVDENELLRRHVAGRPILRRKNAPPNKRFAYLDIAGAGRRQYEGLVFDLERAVVSPLRKGSVSDIPWQKDPRLLPKADPWREADLKLIGTKDSGEIRLRLSLRPSRAGEQEGWIVDTEAFLTRREGGVVAYDLLVYHRERYKRTPELGREDYIKERDRWDALDWPGFLSELRDLSLNHGGGPVIFANGLLGVRARGDGAKHPPGNARSLRRE